MTLIIRSENTADIAAVRHVNESAFPTAAEAKLVDRLRECGLLQISLVAEIAGQIVGHIALSPVTIGDEQGNVLATGTGLAPVAVLPAHQRQSIGTRLIEAAVGAAKTMGLPFIVVLGHPGYYRRFGFRRALEHGLRNEYGVDDPFMVLPLADSGPAVSAGLARYSAPFAELA